MMRVILACLLSCGVAAASSPAFAKQSAIHPAVIADPRPDAAYPAGMSAFVIPAEDGAMNAVLYTAAGAGIHPTLLLLHGFPGNEQNLDLAQAVRRAGWNVLTLHYRGSWGSPGAFSFANASDDAFTALQYLQQPSVVARYRIDTSAIVVAGHSMGGFMAADAAAADPRVAGLFLIDPWDPAQTVAALATPEGEAGWKAEVASDLPPLHGATYEGLTGEIRADGQKFDLGRRLAGYGRRPLTLLGAEKGIGAMARKAAADAQGANPSARLMVWPTDHSFSDSRIALADALVRFLAGVAPTIR
ncbi:alpha/beta hydrolase [Sphingobium cupriresistens LL01]|uniref:Alpha/beta hydrolase n=2 Tax=Sphingobium cupriresistens TaxID=1132417 RepID=A0A0J7Y464_9SPHN|nr:alpha/beta fold hydrolase [Sphingobium cupriresistens]KMS58629.1 alpha/beta hydrolase [Sphingobium cupriresistens LL01]